MSTRRWPWPIALGALLLGLQIAWLWPDGATNSPAVHISYPAETAGRLFDRRLEMLTGLDSEPPWLANYLQFLYGKREHVESRAVQAYREVIASHGANGADLPGWSLRNTQARLLIVLGEGARLSPTEPILAQLARDLEGQAIARAITFAYLRDTGARWNDSIDTGIRRLPDGWTADTLRARVNAGIGDIAGLNWVVGRLAVRSHRLRIRHLFWSTLTGILMIGGGMALLLAARRGLPVAREWALASPPPWSGTQGYAVLLWSAVFGLSIFAATGLLASGHSHPFYSNVLVLWPTLFASIPMVWLTMRYLLRPNGLSITRAFGLFWPSLGQWPWILGLAAAVFALEKFGGLLLSWWVWSTGVQPHWSEDMAHTLVWGSDLKRTLSSVELLLWAPLLEELGFRGLLYLTLRRHCGVALAAVAASALFAFAHAYSLSGLLSVFWGGLVYCLAVEKTRSLLPVVIAHCLGNAIFVGFTFSIYR